MRAWCHFSKDYLTKLMLYDDNCFIVVYVAVDVETETVHTTDQIPQGSSQKNLNQVDIHYQCQKLMQ